MASFSPCYHNWLAWVCFCACICLLPRVSCLACYRLWVEQLLAFHWEIRDIELWLYDLLVPKTSQDIFEVLLAGIMFQYSFDSSISVWYLMLLNVFLWFAYLSLNAVSLTPFFVMWALLFSYAVECFCNIIFWRIDHFFVMRINYLFHVGHAAVPYFNVVFTKQLVKFVTSKKVLIN